MLDLLAAQSALASARAQQVDARLAWSVSLAQLAHDAGVLDPQGGHHSRLDHRHHHGAFPMSPSLRRLLAAFALAAVSPPARRRPRRRPRACRSPSALAERRAVPYELLATGTVEPIQTVAVQAQVSGPIVQGRVPGGPGRDEGPGAVRDRPAAVPAPRSSRPQALLGRDRATAQNAEQEVKRYAALAEKEYVTAQQYDAVRTTAAAASATVASSQAAVDQARLNLQYATIRAPIAGRTGSLLVREGNLVRSTDALPLVTINQIRPILVRFAVPAANLPAIQKYRAQQIVVVRRADRRAALRARARWRSSTTRSTPRPARSCSRPAFPTPTARSGRARS